MLRKGATAHAKNMRVNEDDINSFNRGGSAIRRGGRLLRLDMINTYANWDALLLSLSLKRTKSNICPNHRNLARPSMHEGGFDNMSRT